MKKAITLRRQMTLLMAAIVALQSFALVLALLLSQVFSILDEESVRIFYNTADNRADTFNSSVGNLIINTVNEAEALSGDLQNMTIKTGVREGQLGSDEATYQEASLTIAERLLHFLNANSITGAFVLLDGGSAGVDDVDVHSSIYIRNASPNYVSEEYSNFLFEAGPREISQHYTMPLSSGWSPGVRAGVDDNYYTQPMAAAMNYPGSELERYGYWGEPSDLLGDGQRVVTFSLPLMDAGGTPYGILGFEISLTHLSQHFLPNTELPYENSFYAIAGVQGSTIDLDWYIPGGTLAQVYLQSTSELTITRSDNSLIYGTSLTGLGDMYCSLHTLQMYSRNSPFYDDSWMLIAFVSKSVLSETSENVRTLLLGSILITTCIALVVVVVVSYAATRRISGLTKKVRHSKNLGEISIERTGLGEIDELSAAVENLSRSVMEASQRMSKVMELTDMPIGCFEAEQEGNNVYLTEYVYELLSIAPDTSITKGRWEELYEKMTSCPEPDVENVFRYTASGGTKMWLRILSADTAGGTVGIILDVTADIQEQLRLTQQLDYDALTGLYSRSAFKREAYARIQMAPDEQGAVIFADLDNLKFINDTYGHETGDLLLKQAGEMFRSFEEDGAVVSRIAGDEFALYIHGGGSRRDIRRRILNRTHAIHRSTLVSPDGKEHRIRFSAGVAWYPRDAQDIGDLLKLADFAMYEAKHQRKGTLMEFNAANYEKNTALLENSEALTRLIDEKLIRFDYQPIVSLKTAQIYGYEALMRSATNQFSGPMEILAAATAQNKLYQLERLVMRTACRDIVALRPVLGERYVFMNSLASQQLSENDLQRLNSKFPEYTKNLVLEIAEDKATPISLLREKVELLQAQSICIAVDNISSKLLNKQYILAIKPSIVKINRSVICGMDTSEEKQALVEEIVAFCKEQHIRTVAVGVETAEETNVAFSLGIDFIQGYFTGYPTPNLASVEEEAIAHIKQLNEKI